MSRLVRIKHDLIIDSWHWQPSALATHSLVIPDGCRDLIFSTNNITTLSWRVSPLFNHAKTIQHDSSKTACYGFRLKPGTSIDKDTFYKATKNKNIRNINDVIDDFLSIKKEVSEALDYLASPLKSIHQVKIDLGVSARTLQRLLMKETARSPSYWMLLNRARQAAKSIIALMPIQEVIYHYGYYDQSHLCREIQRWFTCTPNQLLINKDIQQQLKNASY